MEHRNLEIDKKTTAIYELTFKKNGIIEDITDYSVYFTVKEKTTDTDDNAKISKTITTHSKPTDGITLITLSVSDTNINAGNYYYSIDFKDGDNQEGILFYGKLKIRETIRKTRS